MLFKCVEKSLSRGVVVVLASGLVCAGVLAQDADSKQPEFDPKALDELNALGRQVREMGDWSEQAEFISSTIDRFWKKNAWDTEPDDFARTLANDVVRIPPWEFQKRMDKFTDLVAARYKLDVGQRTRLLGRLTRASALFMFKNASMVSGQVREWIDLRVNRRPLTPELVARWTRESEAAFADAMMRMEKLRQATVNEMNADQRKLLERDFERYDHRLNDTVRSRAEWVKGKWSPDEWGLESPYLVESPPSAEMSPVNGRGDIEGRLLDVIDWSKPRPEDAWRRYVREFIHLNELDPGQRTAIESFLTELEARAWQFRRSHASELRSPDAVLKKAADARLDAMFGELKSRAEALLTEVQREAGKNR